MAIKGNPASLSDRLREAREAAGLSQGQVAKKLGLHRPTVTEIEAGRRKVSADELEKFADIYGVPIEWILNGTTGSNSADAKMVMAARELSKMNEADLDRLLKTLQMLRSTDS